MPAKHRQVADSIARRIQTGEIENGARLPGEFELARDYDVSRSTVRQALSNLQKAGLIETWTGSGSFVCYDGGHLNDQVGWSKALSQHGVETRSRIVRFERIDDESLAAELRIGDGSFLALDRVRSTLAGEAISLERSRLPWRRDFSAVLRDGLVGGSLQQTLQARGIRSAGGIVSVGLAQLSETEADLLGRTPGDAFLATRRTVHDAAGALVERVDSLLHPDHFKLQFAFGQAPR
jgi:GntR family transcriptional regulator